MAVSFREGTTQNPPNQNLVDTNEASIARAMQSLSASPTASSSTTMLKRSMDDVSWT